VQAHIVILAVPAYLHLAIAHLIYAQVGAQFVAYGSVIEPLPEGAASKISAFSKMVKGTPPVSRPLPGSNTALLAARTGNEGLTASLCTVPPPEENSAYHIGSVMRAYRQQGLLVYYVEAAPRDYYLEYESTESHDIAAPNREEIALNFDRSALAVGSKIDTFCESTFKWYGAVVKAVLTDNGTKVYAHQVYSATYSFVMYCVSQFQNVCTLS
jgi:hypothetical protein